jgi:hypothetical protein
MINNKKIEHAIDAVILWVDGKDEMHCKKMLPYIDEKQSKNDASFRTRFDQVEEIKFSVDSILTNASWIRNIFIVTDSQVPKFLRESGSTEEYRKIIIVDHKVIFEGYEEYLPTFNSLSIETMVHRIPDLAEHYIYLNDDFFIIKKTKPSDFFKNGLPVLRGKKSLFDEFKIEKKLKRVFKIGYSKNRVSFKRTQQETAKMLGFTQNYFRIHHTPHSQRKSTFQNYFKEHPYKLIENIKYRFRNKVQFLPQSLVHHIELNNKTCVVKNSFQLAYLQSYKKPILWYKLYFYCIQKNSEKLFLCLQSLDKCDEKKLKFLNNQGKTHT